MVTTEESRPASVQQEDDLSVGQGRENKILLWPTFRQPVGDLTTGAQVQVPGDYCGQRDVWRLVLAP